MADRDEKGRFVKGHKALGKPFKAGGEQVETARQAGIASGESKRRHKAWAEELDEILQAKVRSNSGTEATKNRVILEQQVNKAINGDTRAAQFVGEITGDYKRNVDVTLGNDEPLILLPLPKK